MLGIEGRYAHALYSAASKEKKLSNTNFAEKAPADVVQRERDSLAEAREQLAQVQSVLAGLRASAK